MADDDGFLSRWSKRKVQARTGEPPAEPERVAPKVVQAPATTPPLAAATTAATPGALEQPATAVDQPAQPTEPPAPLPTMDDVLALTKESDYSAFVKPGVDPTVRNAAFKKLFSDPFFNEMDGLDIYIDDYSQPNPLPLSLARKLTSAKVLNLFETPEEKAARLAKEAADNPVAPATAEPSAPSAPPGQAQGDEPSADSDTPRTAPENTPSITHEAPVALEPHVPNSGTERPQPIDQPKHTP